MFQVDIRVGRMRMSTDFASARIARLKHNSLQI